MKVKKRFVVVRHGVNKDTGECYSKLCQVKSGKSKDNGTPYEFIDEKIVEYIDGEMLPVGKVLMIESTLSEEPPKEGK
jgi:hypothetical protein